MEREIHHEKRVIPDWIKMGASVLAVGASAIWYTAAEQSSVDQRLASVEEAQRQSVIDKQQVMDKLNSIQRSLIEIQTVLHYENKDSFPLPQESSR